MIDTIRKQLGERASLLDYKATGRRGASMLHLPGPDFVDRVFVPSDRPSAVLRNLCWMFGTGRLADTGYLSILPVDQGIEHSGAASFAPNAGVLRPREHREARARGRVQRGRLDARRPRLRSRATMRTGFPFIVKLNHNELLTYPATYDETMYASVKQAFEMGAVGVGATIYFGAENSRRQITEISQAFQHAHELGMFTVLWCYLRNPAFKTKDQDFHVSRRTSRRRRTTSASRSRRTSSSRSSPRTTAATRRSRSGTSRRRRRTRSSFRTTRSSGRAGRS